MTKPNKQIVERGHLITVTLIDAQDADVFIRRPDGKGEHPTRIDLAPFFAAGMSEGDALDAALGLVAIGVRCSA